ncbi:MAG: aminoglycoside phosphotransferase family protein [Lachnospiraceae bacterium]|nr:aminoglycoside phosphotransferase family protein [Lachnospiraceae bacterium]
MKTDKITNIQAAEKYLSEYGAQTLAGGKSGAQVYDIAGKYVLKRMRRDDGEKELFESCCREVLWYESAEGSVRDCLPEILDMRNTDDETAILMRRYRAVPRNEINTELEQKIMRTLAVVHSAGIPMFLRKERKKAQPVADAQLQEAAAGWRSVLDEHPGAFDESALARTAEKINVLIRWHDSEEAVLNHGDFHWDNLLQNEQGGIILCDWQSVSAGPASGDLSFFFSRLRADGIYPDEREIAELYARELKRLSGRTVTWEELDRHIRAANIITSFLFWHFYLHGSGEERVREIYEKMTEECL